jgi:toxin ParE1/3/4
MPHEVFLTADAAHDLEEIIDYIAGNDGAGKADTVPGKFEALFASLSQSPKRGAHPRELLALGIRQYRELFFKPYRAIYRVEDRAVYILLVADGRRDLQTLLQRRLLGA